MMRFVEVYLLMMLTGNAVSQIVPIIDVRLDPSDNVKTQVGMVTVQLDLGMVWTQICEGHRGRVWGNLEATVVCRQLQFEGGWSYPVEETSPVDSSIGRIHNVACNGSERTLEGCIYEYSQTDCYSTFAGVKCYESFYVQLFGGSASNEGRVEVKYDDVWTNICYNKSPVTSRHWSMKQVQIICREMGFPGAMLEGRGGYGNGTRSSIVNYNCLSGKAYSSIAQCAGQPEVTGNSCGYGNEAVAICAVPGYLGCYGGFGNTFNMTVAVRYYTSDTMTINECRDFCRQRNFQYASLQMGNTCNCGDGPISGTPMGDNNCQTRCLGNNNQVCGSSSWLSVYDVTIGLCPDPMNGVDVYYFGDTYPPVGFECGAEMELVGTPIQCVLGNSPNESRWSDAIPECRFNTSGNSKTKNWLPATNNNNGYIYIIIGAVAGCVVFVGLGLLVGLLLYKRQRRRSNTAHDTVGEKSRSKSSTNSGRRQLSVDGDQQTRGNNDEIQDATGGQNTNSEYAYAEVGPNAGASELSRGNNSDECSKVISSSQPAGANSRVEYSYADMHLGSECTAGNQRNIACEYAYAEVNNHTQSNTRDVARMPSANKNVECAAYAVLNPNSVPEECTDGTPMNITDCIDVPGYAILEGEQGDVTNERRIPSTNQGIIHAGSLAENNKNGQYSYADFTPQRKMDQHGDTTSAAGVDGHSQVEGWAENVAYVGFVSPDEKEEVGDETDESEGWVDNKIYGN